jgi:hypothetical protein
MDLTNDSYLILLRNTKTGALERYYRDKRSANDKKCWVKESVRGNIFRATAEQVLNHLLPALAGIQPVIAVEVEHHPKHE